MKSFRVVKYHNTTLNENCFSNLGSWRHTKKLIRNQLCMTIFRTFNSFSNCDRSNTFRCDIISIFQLEGSLEYQFAVVRGPKKITFLVILRFSRIRSWIFFSRFGLWGSASIDRYMKCIAKIPMKFLHVVVWFYFTLRLPQSNQRPFVR